MVIQGVIFPEVRWDFRDLKALAVAALKIKKGLSGPEHQFPHRVDGRLPGATADPALIRLLFHIFRSGPVPDRPRWARGRHVPRARAKIFNGPVAPLYPQSSLRGNVVAPRSRVGRAGWAAPGKMRISRPAGYRANVRINSACSGKSRSKASRCGISKST